MEVFFGPASKQHYSLNSLKLNRCEKQNTVSLEATKMGSHLASGGYKYRGLVLRDGGWAWG